MATREDAIYRDYRAAEEAAIAAMYEQLLATDCAACGAPLGDSPYFDDHGAICATCAKKENPPTMKVSDALKEAARLTRGRAEYFEMRAGRRGSSLVPPAPSPLERARFERTALAFEQAATVIESLADEGRFP
jgi:hypothetical protein